MVKQVETVKVGEEEKVVLRPKWGIGVDEMFRGTLQLNNLVKEGLVIDFNGELVEVNDNDSVDDLIEKYHS